MHLCSLLQRSIAKQLLRSMPSTFRRMWGNLVQCNEDESQVQEADLVYSVTLSPLVGPHVDLEHISELRA